MSWISWTSLVPTLLILSASLAWWLTELSNSRVNLFAALGLGLCCWAVAPELSRNVTYSVYAWTVDALATLQLELLILRHAKMLLTGGAVVWLARRAWQTLWKPVPELISILGVDVPDPPDVSLAGIRADAATVNWTRPPANRSVQKFLIQVNGVVVGEVAANQEPAIVVSGLKPDHFYNVRVIAVGSNNFQAGSRVIRLRTFGRDGRPQIGNSRLPSNFPAEEPHGSIPSEIGDEAGGSRTAFPALEAATPPDGVGSPAQDRGPVAPSGPRRNTVTRRHSPSTTSLDQPIRDDVNAHTSKTLPELTEQFESIRKETEDVLALIAKEEADNRVLLEELEAEKREKKKEQKKKEEQTEKLKRDVNSTDRTMRNAMQRKAQREKLLREKQNERSKFHDSIAKWDKGVEDMRGNRESFDQQKTGLEGERDRKAECLRSDNDGLHTECSRLEAELREKRELVRELEEARKKLPGGEDDSEWQERDEAFKREWARRQRELQEALALEAKRARELDQEFRILTMQLQANPHAAYAIFSQANTSGLEFDNPGFAQSRRRSRPSNSLSNASVPTTLPAYSQIDPAMSAPTGFASSRSANAPPGFAPGPFMIDLPADIPNRPNELSNRAAPAPLSPSATALLPSNILADLDDEPSPTARFGYDPFMSQQRASPEDAPLSPASSGKSLSIFSSPHGSMSLNAAAAAVPSPIATEPPPNKLGSFFSFQRSRPAKVMEKEGPLLGSLKQGQSQSFPRQTDEDGLMNKRRISLSGTWNVFNRNSVEPEIAEGHGANPRMLSRNLNPFSSSHRPAGGLFPERDPSSPRPASIASSEFPRPSTDSSSIWGPPPDPAALGKPSRLWSPDAPWSRNASRRPSLHGSPSALKTTLASADDEILGEEMLPNVREVGVIGSRPPAHSSKPLGRLNPNAPAFIGSFFKSKPDREKDKEGKEKTKAEKKDRSKAKDSKEKPKSKEPASTPETSQAPSIELESPSESRKSRDGISVHTLASVSESRDSLSLDHSFSNTPSEPTSAGLPGSFKEDNVVRKLFRKSSSSKFSFAGRLGGKESGLFKKGPSSTISGAASDKGTSIERTSIGDFDDIADEIPNPGFLGRSYDSVTSSPSLGPISNAKNKENKATVRWLSNFKKGKKEKESLELDRSQFSELDGLSEEGSKN
ncbi:hypothetical protein MMYC01_200627 [Madurella mycetomatis]|uniref:Fibronectin type-III domain-containing protein n=1 Tax=Madurella mycetomatis TaxID=100816 RepID=A0A175WHI8_9PEZI|nr:hypothetical protein MMYC01_200627 [Madurella mycetomatis]